MDVYQELLPFCPRVKAAEEHRQREIVEFLGKCDSLLGQAPGQETSVFLEVAYMLGDFPEEEWLWDWLKKRAASASEKSRFWRSRTWWTRGEASVTWREKSVFRGKALQGPFDKRKSDPRHVARDSPTTRPAFGGSTCVIVEARRFSGAAEQLITLNANP
jgi:hypothetical protein